MSHPQDVIAAFALAAALFLGAIIVHGLNRHFARTLQRSQDARRAARRR